MSLFTTIIDNPDGKGRISIFVEGSTGEGEKYVLGQGASVNPALSKSPFKNWKRSTTIHTHPYGGPLDFSNELEGFASGGDLQWAVRTEVDVYLVPPSGNVMGKFSICTYMDILRSYLLSHDSKDGYFKKMPYSEMFKAGGPGDPYYSKREARAAMQTVVINPE